MILDELVGVAAVLAILGQPLVYAIGRRHGEARARRDITQRMKAGLLPSYSVAPDGRSITCHVCGMTSHHPMDVQNKFCAKCHVFHEERWLS